MEKEEEPPDREINNIFLDGLIEIVEGMPSSEIDEINHFMDSISFCYSGKNLKLDRTFVDDNYRRIYKGCLEMFMRGIKKSGFTTSNGDLGDMMRYLTVVIDDYYSRKRIRDEEWKRRYFEKCQAKRDKESQLELGF